jgi:hypothetical protein
VHLVRLRLTMQVDAMSWGIGRLRLVGTALARGVELAFELALDAAIAGATTEALYCLATTLGGYDRREAERATGSSCIGWRGGFGDCWSGQLAVVASGQSLEAVGRPGRVRNLPRRPTHEADHVESAARRQSRRWG